MRTTSASWAARHVAGPWIDASEWTASDVHALDALFRARPPGRYDVVLLEPGAAPVMHNRTSLEDHLALHGVGRAAKTLRRTWPPPGTALVMLISDRGCGFKYWPLPASAPATTCSAMTKEWRL